MKKEVFYSIRWQKLQLPINEGALSLIGLRRRIKVFRQNGFGDISLREKPFGEG